MREFFDFILLLATVALGFFGGPWWCVVGTTIGLYSFRWEEWQELGVRARRIGAGDAYVAAMLTRFLFAAAAAGAAFWVEHLIRIVAGL